MNLIPKAWYWVRRDDGSLAPYVFHRLRRDPKTGKNVADFFVGSFVQTFRLSQIEAAADVSPVVRPAASSPNERRS